jgi:hypothetical protein
MKINANGHSEPGNTAQLKAKLQVAAPVISIPADLLERNVYFKNEADKMLNPKDKEDREEYAKLTNWFRDLESRNDAKELRKAIENGLPIRIKAFATNTASDQGDQYYSKKRAEWVKGEITSRFDGAVVVAEGKGPLPGAPRGDTSKLWRYAWIKIDKSEATQKILELRSKEAERR